MNIILYNFKWMGLNVFLAVIPVVLGWLFLSTKNKYLKTLLGAFWLIFLPNSIYLFTDLINLVRQWGKAGSFVHVVFIFQYSILLAVGFFSYVLSLYPFEKFLLDSRFVRKRVTANKIIILLNFIIGFGLTLGRVERVHSWHVISDPASVIRAALNILTSLELLLLTLLFGIFANCLYFLFRNRVVKYVKAYLRYVTVIN